MSMFGAPTVAHACNFSIWEAEAGALYEYIVTYG